MKRLLAVVLIAVVMVAGTGAVFARTEQGKRVVRYVERRFSLTEQGRLEAFQALWYQAKAEYYTAVPNPYGPFQKADYPAKAKLLTHRHETLSALKQDLANYADEPFLADLLVSLGADAARPLLEQWLRTGPCYYASPILSNAVAASFTPDQLKQLSLELPGYCAQTVYNAIPMNAKDPAYAEALLLKHGGAAGRPYWFDDYMYGEAVRLFPRLDRTTKLMVLGQATFRKLDGHTVRGWLNGETDPAVRQELYFLLNDTEALLASIEMDGAYKGNSFWSNWRWMKETTTKYPDSYLARGVKAYEAVRGMPYYGIDRAQAGIPMWQYGNHWYDCDREIPGWEAYLQAYSKHDGADDAAYRLGRCYEITGQYAKALGALRLAMDLPDGEMAYHAGARIAWILDVAVPDEQLRSLKPADPGLQQATAYSLAVRELRGGRYAEAAAGLAALLQGEHPAPLPEPAFGRTLDFWQGVSKQRDLADKLALLAQQPTPENRYAIAATMYHEEQLFYNYLWYGGKLGYLMEKGNPIDGDMTPAVERWAFESNNYLQAAKAFEPLETAAGAVGDKAMYSEAMALLRATQSLTPDVPLFRSREEINQEANSLLEQFVATRPTSDLAPDALLSLGFLTRNQAYFDRILKEYPRSNAAVTARNGLDPNQLWRDWHVIPYTYLTLEEAPTQVAEWARPFLGKAGARSMTLGEYTYVLGTTDQVGKAVTAGVGPNYDGPGLSAGVSLWNDPRKTEPDYALIRFRAGTEKLTVSFYP